jgi:hypothetical protein
MGTTCVVQAKYIGRESGGQAYGASCSELSSSSRPRLDTEDASSLQLDSAASSSPDSAASSSPDSPELVASPLEELFGLAADDVPGRE